MISNMIKQQSGSDPVRSGLSPRALSRFEVLCSASGSMGAMWFTVCSPQPIFNVFIKNYLGASSTQLGLLVMLIQLTSLFQLLSIFVYGKLNRRKPFFVGVHIVKRLLSISLAAAALLAVTESGKHTALRLVFVSMGAAFSLMNLSASGWWSWVADLVPDSVRGAFFGRRSAIVNAINMVWFFGVTLALDAVSPAALSVVYAGVFIFATLVGVVDIVIYFFVPEFPQEEQPPFSFSSFIEPLKNRNFIVFCLVIGLALFSINIFGPFSGPFVTDPTGVGAPNTWLGIMFIISQFAWITSAGPLGIMMDRYGRKPVVIIGGLFTLSWLGYLVVGPSNYTFVLPVIALVGGVLAPGFWEGVNQLMLSLTPSSNRVAYVAWYSTITATVSSLGSYVGGTVADGLGGFSLALPGPFVLHGIHIVLLVSLGMVIFSMVLLSRIKEGKVREFGYVVSRVAHPGIFKTFFNLDVIGRTADSHKVERVLRSMEGRLDEIAVQDVILRLDDPSSDVRREAARALGRIGGNESIAALIGCLENPFSGLRIEAAQSLGRLGDPSAVPALIRGLSDGSEALQEACAQALGGFPGNETAHALLDLVRSRNSDWVAVSGAESVSRMGLIQAGWEIFPRMLSTQNSVLRRQYAIALGNLLGHPGEFYQYITGNAAHRQTRIMRLFVESAREAERIPGGRAVSAKIRQAGEFFRDGEGHRCQQLLIDAAGAVLEDYSTPGKLPGKSDGELENRERLTLFSWLLGEIIATDTDLDGEIFELESILIVYTISSWADARDTRPRDAVPGSRWR